MDANYLPSMVQWGIVFGSFGWFTLLFMVFCKIVPSVSMYEVKEMVYHRSLATKKAALGLEGGH
jgi:molybdopterin-containing oxidoreductase family membrane subunit